ncbi:MAG TPA: DNA polymerase/3'-5' exonuclease PolX [Verrucomicrobiae bacterium]|nr:DNA polymerase/3'-5' exonuclease PolX [Verrucomicrobiae bacterium]
MDKNAVIDMLERIAVLLELRNENVFKTRAFQNAARVLEGCPSDLAALCAEKELESLKGIGKGHIARIVRECHTTGKCSDYEELRKGFPDGIFEMLRIPGLGAKRAKILYDKLGIDSVKKLTEACKKGKLKDLDGFGEKTQTKLLQGIERLRQTTGLFLHIDAEEAAENFVSYLKKTPGIRRIQVAGSLRRRKEIVRDIDILVAADKPEAVHAAFVKYPGVRTVVAQGTTKTTVTLRMGINCDLRTVTESQFAAALYYFTGSKEHNVAVRTLAKKKKIKINEYGLFRGEKLIPCKDESDIFKAVGLSYIPPEARENMGEIELAAKGKFPGLVEEKDLRGVFHVHSDYSDGAAPLRKMIEAAERMGLEYVGISDHSRSAAYAGGLEVERVYKQWKEIDKLQKDFKIRIFKGIESDILQDGSLDYPEDVLKGFDFVIGSVHSRFTMPEKEMTNRIVRAMENKYLTWVGHITGRLLLKRVGYTVDMGRIFEASQKTGASIELNADPNRLDLDWRLCYHAREKGLRLGIHPDAHSVEGLKSIRYGVAMARKAWLQKKDVLNTLPLAQMEKYLKVRK